MTKEELQALGLNDEQITEVFKLKGKVVNELKEKITLLETEKINLETQINTANAEIESYKSMDFEGIKKSADEYKEKFEKLQKDSEDNLKALKFEHLVDMELSNAKAKNSKAVKALLDLENLSKSNNINEDLKNAIETVKSENDYLFESDNADLGGSVNKGNTLPAKDLTQLSYEEFASQFK